MARKPRIVIAGLPYHVYQRAINGQDCYFDSQDRHYFMQLLDEAIRDHGCSIHAYVLMTNHFHLLITLDQPSSLPDAMHNVKSRYSRHLNRKCERTGPLWEGRYKAVPIETENYLFACQRYIELNPVRAGMVSHPGEYPWSSYRCNAGLTFDRLIRPHELFSSLGDTPEARHSAYGALFEDVVDEEAERIFEATLRQVPIGSKSFRASLVPGTTSPGTTSPGTFASTSGGGRGRVLRRSSGPFPG